MSTVTQTITVQSRFGLHIRPAQEVSQLASGYDAEIALSKGDKVAHAQSVMELMTLGAFSGDELKITAIGKEAEEGMQAIISVLSSFSADNEKMRSYAT